MFWDSSCKWPKLKRTRKFCTCRIGVRLGLVGGVEGVVQIDGRVFGEEVKLARGESAILSGATTLATCLEHPFTSAFAN